MTARCPIASLASAVRAGAAKRAGVGDQPRKPDAAKISGPSEKRTTGLLSFIRSRLDATGTAVAITNLRDGTYDPDDRAYLGLKRDARDIRPAPRPPGARNAERLSEPKTLRGRGLISEEEYQAKRRQILDRM